MRTISCTELPQSDSNTPLIKSNAHKRQRQLGEAIERTLKHCHEIKSECEQQLEALRSRHEREGFSAGFQRFFKEILSLLCNYESMQHERLDKFRQQMHESIKQVMVDPIVLERILSYLQLHCKSDDELTLFLPAGTSPPPSNAHLTCLFTEDLHITLQSGSQTLRFPVESLCQRWLTEADNNVKHVNNRIDALIPTALENIIQTLRQHGQIEQKENKNEFRGQ